MQSMNIEEDYRQKIKVVCPNITEESIMILEYIRNYISKSWEHNDIYIEILCKYTKPLSLEKKILQILIYPLKNDRINEEQYKLIEPILKKIYLDIKYIDYCENRIKDLEVIRDNSLNDLNKLPLILKDKDLETIIINIFDNKIVEFKEKILNIKEE